MPNLYSEKKQCSGCAACVNICPKNAISMQSDQEGFLYPKIDEKLCVQCGACEKVCHLKNNNYDKLKNNNRFAVALKHNENCVITESSSGGAFTAISDYILSQGGHVWGAIFDNDMNVVHMKATNSEERNMMRGSKYVQSSIINVYKSIKESLNNTDVPVLFSGTPCQIAGLRAYLGNKTDLSKLFLCDVVCNGITSPKMWKDHIDFVEKKRRRKVVDYKFRDKSSKVGGAYTSTIFYASNRRERASALCQSYIDLYNGKTVRPSCYDCKYSDKNRVSDITIADFWGVDKVFPEFNDKKGVSLVLVNTEKGEKIFDNIKEQVDYKECKIEQCMQPRLHKAINLDKERQKFWDEYKQKGYKYVLKKYSWYGGKKRIKFELNKCIPNKLKGIAKNILKKFK